MKNNAGSHFPGALVASSRLREWWFPKAGNLLAVIFLLVAITRMPPATAAVYLLPSLLTILGIGGFGYVVNDWLDIPSDQRAGKPNRMAKFSVGYRVAIVFCFLLVALLPWLLLPWDTNSLFLLGIEFFLLFWYATPPFRFKERSWLGVLADGLYAYAVPAVLAAYTYFLIMAASPDFTFLGLLFLWQFFTGIHNILIHQVEDYPNDLRAGIRTFAVATGKTFATKATTNYVLIPELVCFLALLFYISRHYFPGYFVLPLLWVLFRYVPLLYSSSFRVLARLGNTPDMQAANLPYHKILLWWHLFWACWVQPIYWMPVAMAGVAFFIKNKNRFRQTTLFKYLSLLGNQLIFAWRVYGSGATEKTALREHYDAGFYGNIPSREEHLPTIALVNQNKQKYTETFVRQHLLKLPFDVYFYHSTNGNFPDRGMMGHLLSNYAPVLFTFRMLREGGDLPQFYYEKKAFQRELVHKKVQLVLAEFGTTAGWIAPACREVGVPLVAIFYGYDGFHQPTLAENAGRYQYLFKTATALIGVSRDMTEQLARLGAPAEKLHYLPCAVDLERFRYVDHSHCPPVFLAVGRFAETKSPHLTILAFEKVLQAVPSAKLVMIGKDGGGELFEACHILAKALNIEGNIEFRGIQSHEAVYRAMQTARVFVQHSVTTPLHGDKEGTPVAIMEAMACGLPVVATRHAGIPEMITHEATGFLVEEYDVEAMAANMIRLCNDDDLVKTTGEAASRYIHQHPLIPNHIELLSTLIQETLAARK